MERPYLGFAVSALVGVATMGGLAFVWGAPRPGSGSGGRPQGEWRLLEPVTYENIAIFPVVGSSQDTRAFLMLDEGLSSGEVVISEQTGVGLARSRDHGRPMVVPDYNSSASVNQLVLVNRSKRPLLLLAGELVSGGKQDRIIAKDRLVAPGGEPLPLDVFCVEHGRWSSGSQFTEARTIVHPSVREQAAVKQAQTDVWNAVVAGTTAQALAGVPRKLGQAEISVTVNVEAPTQSYRKIYESRHIGQSVDGFVDELQRRFDRATSGLKGERIVGVVVAYGGEVAWSDIFASSDLFEHYWSKLLRSYVVEALARPTVRETASTKDAQEFLQPLNGHETQETEAGVYQWRETREGRLALIELEALQPKPVVVHRLLLHRTS